MKILGEKKQTIFLKRKEEAYSLMMKMGLFIAIIVFSSCGKDKDDDIIDEEIVYYECTKGEEEFVLYGKKSAVEFQIQELNKTWEALGTPVRCKRKI